MQFDALTAIVVAANLLGGSTALPQAHRLYTTRRVAGVSAVWAGMSAAINLGWGIYGIGVADLAIMPVSFVSVAAYTAIAVALIRYSPATRRAVLGRLAAGFSVFVLPLPALLLWGWSGAGIALGLLYALQLSPAVIEVYRSADVSGVSAATWLISWVEALLWGLYGFPVGDIGLLALAATGLAMSSLVLVRLLLRGGRVTTSNPAVRAWLLGVRLYPSTQDRRAPHMPDGYSLTPGGPVT